MRRTLPHEIIALVVFLHERGIQNGWQNSAQSVGKAAPQWHRCRHTHATHTSVVTSRLSESIHTSMGHSIVAYVSSLSVFDVGYGTRRREAENGASSGPGPSTDRRSFYRAQAMPMGAFGGGRIEEKDQGDGVRGWTIIKTDQNEPIVHVLAALDSELFQLQFFIFIPISITTVHPAKEWIPQPTYRLRQRWTVISRMKRHDANWMAWSSSLPVGLAFPPSEEQIAKCQIYTFIYRLILVRSAFFACTGTTECNRIHNVRYRVPEPETKPGVSEHAIYHYFTISTSSKSTSVLETRGGTLEP
jgi:hypothetical protein